MDKKNITPNPQQPVDRVPTGKLPSALAELEEASLSGTHTLPLSWDKYGNYLAGRYDVTKWILCSYDGEDE